VHHGHFRDCNHLIKPCSIDAIITDPPYGSGGFTVRDRVRSSKEKYVTTGSGYAQQLPDIDGDAIVPERWDQLMRDFLVFSHRAMTDHGILLAFIDWRNIRLLQDIILRSPFTLRGVCVSDKSPSARPIKNGFRNQSEFILWASKGPMPDRDPPIYLPGVFRHTAMSNGKQHITQKPEPLMCDLIEICRPRGTIMDPFMGVATTGVAALKTDRKFIGCETIDHYFHTAVQRLKPLKN